MAINTGIINSGGIGGNATVSNLKGHFSHDVRVASAGSGVDVKRRLDFPGRDPEVQTAFVQLLGELEKLREDYPAETRRIVSVLELVIQELGTEKRNHDFLASSWELTKKALGDLIQSVPALAILGGKFVESVSLRFELSR